MSKNRDVIIKRERHDYLMNHDSEYSDLFIEEQELIKKKEEIDKRLDTIYEKMIGKERQIKVTIH